MSLTCDLAAVGIAELSHEPLDDPVVQTLLVGELAERSHRLPIVLDQFLDVVADFERQVLRALSNRRCAIDRRQGADERPVADREWL
jgi:hypothetical protein